MLLIGDLHLNARITDHVLQLLEKYITDHDQTSELCFLGDVVYHFSYHKASMMKFFAYCMTLRKQGKKIYFLAGNHDRLQDQFVFAESKHIFAHIDEQHFFLLTQPWYQADQKRLFLPYMIDIPHEHFQGLQQSTLPPTMQNIYKDIFPLLSSSHDKDVLSAKINLTLLSYLTKYPDIETVFHHYYIANTRFPGQNTRFSYRDVSLHPGFLCIENISLIAGHLHQSFSYKNFFCTGSVWATSPTEYNHEKYLWKLGESKDITGTTCQTPLYLHLPYKEQGYTSGDITSYIQCCRDQQRSHLDQGHFSCDYVSTPLPLLEHIHLHIAVQYYEELEHIIDPTITQQARSIRAQKNTSPQAIIEQLHTQGKNLGTSLQDRKELLQEYLQKKFGQESEKYIDELRTLQLWR